MVNNNLTVKISEEFEAFAVRILRDALGAEVRPTRNKLGPDLVLDSGDRPIEMALECKTRMNAANARQATQRAEELGGIPLMVVAGETTAEAREILRSSGVAYVDGLGNSDIRLPGLVYRLDGRSKPGSLKQTRITGKAGRVALKLLQEPHRGWHIKDLAEATRVSPGFVHRVLARLGDEGILESEGRGPTKVRIVRSPGALLDLWAEEKHDKVERIRAYQLARTPALQRRAISDALEKAGVSYALTGASAAELVAPLISSVPVTQVWVSALEDPRELLESVPADAVDTGHNLVFMQSRDDDPLLDRQRVDEMWVANDFRLYLDLREDPRRGAEQAEHLRRRRIGF